MAWTYGMGMPTLAVWLVLLPYWAFRILKNNQDKLNKAEMKSKYAFLYNGYRNEKYYWEFIIMIRKLVLICVNVFAGWHSTNL